MDFFKDRRVVLGLGALVAILLGVIIALVVTRTGPKQDQPPPASQGGLIVQPGAEESGLDPARPLRCFVDGQFVGEITLAECAQKNGVATGALDVGVDETGALAAAGAVQAPTPPPVVPTDKLPPQPATPPQQQAQAPPSPAPVPAPSQTAGGASCWAFDGSWQKLPESMDLNACVQRLYAGRCARFGQANYGRWGQQTLRLVRGRVEISDDNRRFRTLARQGRDCAIAPVG